MIPDTQLVEWERLAAPLDWPPGTPYQLVIKDESGVTIPERTDCAWCFFQRLPEWKRLRKRHPEAYAAGEAIEAEIGYTFRSKSRDSWPAGLTELKAAFDSGRPVRGYSEDRQLRFPDCDREVLCRVCSM